MLIVRNQRLAVIFQHYYSHQSELSIAFEVLFKATGDLIVFEPFLNAIAHRPTSFSYAAPKPSTYD